MTNRPSNTALSYCIIALASILCIGCVGGLDQLLWGHPKSLLVLGESKVVMDTVSYSAQVLCDSIGSGSCTLDLSSKQNAELLFRQSSLRVSTANGLQMPIDSICASSAGKVGRTQPFSVGLTDLVLRKKKPIYIYFQFRYVNHAVTLESEVKSANLPLTISFELHDGSGDVGTHFVELRLSGEVHKYLLPL